MQAIALIDALQQMELPTPFQIKFVTADRAKKTGGKIIELTKAFKVGAKHNQRDNDTITIRQEGNSNHPYPVHIHLITEFNGQKVFL